MPSETTYPFYVGFRAWMEILLVHKLSKHLDVYHKTLRKDINENRDAIQMSTECLRIKTTRPPSLIPCSQVFLGCVSRGSGPLDRQGKTTCLLPLIFYTVNC